MPYKPKSPCPVPRCPELTDGGRCKRHRKEQIREWEARSGRGSAAGRGYNRAWQRIRAQVIAERPWCQSAGCPRPSSEAHHIVARRDGGPDCAENLLPLYKSHHSQATNREKWERKGREMTPPNGTTGPRQTTPTASLGRGVQSVGKRVRHRPHGPRASCTVAGGVPISGAFFIGPTQ
jgi:5-methylcytosine-specific restriction enzyme A